MREPYTRDLAEAVDGGEGDEGVCELRREMNGGYGAVKEME